METIRFAVRPCPLGLVLVGATSAGVCLVAFGDDPGALARELRRRFPRAELAGADGECERLATRIVAAIEQPAVGLDLLLDVRGTAFQRRVWQELRGIPCGETSSYAEVARVLGAPLASRAVAQACAANPLAVLIPCHRVVRSDGSLSGYRWGIERKAWLLQEERRGREIGTA